MPTPRSPRTRRRPWASALVLTGTTVAGMLVAAPAAQAEPSSVPTTATSPQVGGARDGFLDGSLELREVRLHHDLIEARAQLDAARAGRRLLTDHVAELKAQAAGATQRAEQLRQQMDGQPVGGLLDTIAGLVSGDETVADRAVDAVDDERHAWELVTIATAGLSESERAITGAARQLSVVRRKADRLEELSAAQTFARNAAATAELDQAYDVTDRAQDRLNRHALRRWQRYLIDLGNAGILPPRARRLQDPDDLPGSLEPMRDRRGLKVAGVARVETEQGETIPVLPVETIEAVSRSFGLLGLPAGELTSDSRAFSCGGLVARVWSGTPVPDTAPAQWQRLRPAPVKRPETGDLVFLDGDEAAGLPDRAAVALDDELVIAADPATGTPAVQPADDVVGARRPSLAPRGDTNAQTSPVSCADPIASEPAPTNGWRLPLDAGTFQLSVGFDSAGPLWSSGAHTGQDFAAPIGTPVRAAHAGTAHVEHPGWAGNLVRIDHGNGVETWYAHLSRMSVTEGQQLAAGDPVGEVGDEGNSTGPHLHFEVRIDGRAVDPMPVLTGSAPLLGAAPPG